MAGALGLRGVPLPAQLMQANQNNPRGYFESQPIYALHEELLASVGSSWDDVCFSFDRHLDTGHLNRWVDRFAEAIREEYADEPLFVLKDPRICRLLPLWQRVLEKVQAKPVCILVVRNPLEVCRSLDRAHGTEFGKGALLWLQHWLAAERGSRKFPRSFVRYENLLQDWRSVIENVVSRLHLSLPALGEATARSMDEFLTPEMRHQCASLEEVFAHEGLSEWVKNAYREAVCTTEANRPSRRVQDRIWREFENARAAFGPMLMSARKLEDRSSRLEEMLASRDAQISELDRQSKTLTGRIRKLESHVKGLEAELARRGERVAALEEHARQQGAMLAERADRLASLEEHTAGLEGELGRREERIGALESHTAGLEAELARRGERVMALESRRRELEEEAQGLREDLEAIRATAWFRIGQRLRRKT